MSPTRLAPRLATGVAMIAMLAAAAPAPAPTAAQGQTTGPVATYWMSVMTATGLPGTGGGRPNPMAMMQAMSGPQGPRQSLLLQLGSTQSATGMVRADHMPPADLGVGDRMPLATVEPSGGVSDNDRLEEVTPPDTRILVYYGCGETARGRQPVSIALGQEGARQLIAVVNNHRVNRGNPPTANNSRTYGEWPNARGRTQNPTGSLVGEHLVRGSYTPDIRFTLDAGQDFLAPLQLTGLGEEGPLRLGWNAVPNAKGYLAYTFGQNEAGDVIIWSSSEVAAFPMYLPELLAPSELSKLQASKVVLPASATSCAVPSAVTTAAPDSMLRVIAYGGETNISWPPRPADRNAPWNIESVVKVRYNSTAGAVLGMDMADMGDGDEAGSTSINPLDALPGGEAARALGSALGRFRRR